MEGADVRLATIPRFVDTDSRNDCRDDPMSDDNKIRLLKPEFPPDDIVSTLRKIAEGYEKGDFGFSTTCVVVLGHTEDKMIDGEKYDHDHYEMFGCGPRCDIFTIRGLLLTCATRI